MRTLTTVLAIALATSWSAIVVIVARLLRLPMRAGSVYERQMMQWASALTAAAGVKVVLHGEENMTAGGGVYICNHVSWFDVFSIASRLPRCTFVAKYELRKIPIFGWGAESAGVVFLDRDNRKAAFESYKVAAAAVQDGRRIVVFPEGTRGFDYHLRQFKKGPFVLAISSEEPIIPTVIYGAREVMGKGSFKVRSGTVHIHFLQPIVTRGRTYDDRHEIMEATRQEMADLLEREYGVTSHQTPNTTHQAPGT
jgi:1-acyl-sn-glycerol-3-phosphate acyltransferase